MRKIVQKLLTKIVPTSIKFNIGPLPIYIAPGWMWIPIITSNEPVLFKFHKRVKDCYNPKRWGGGILMIEIGSRG